MLCPEKELNEMLFFFQISALKILVIATKENLHMSNIKCFLAAARRPQFRAKIVCDYFFTLFIQMVAVCNCDPIFYEFVIHHHLSINSMILSNYSLSISMKPS